MGHVAGTQDKQEADVQVRLGLRAAPGVGWGAGGAGVESQGPALLPWVCSSRQTHPPLCFGLAKRLTFNQARRFLGLHRCRQYFSLGLGLSRATLDFFLSLNMPILALYGLSESTGVHTVSRPHDFRLLRWVPVEGRTGGRGGGAWGGAAWADLDRGAWSRDSVLPHCGTHIRGQTSKRIPMWGDPKPLNVSTILFTNVQPFLTPWLLGREHIHHLVKVTLKLRSLVPQT